MTNCSDSEGMMLAASSVISYVTIIGTIIFFGKFFNSRLHDFKTECYLERQRQNEMIEKLFALAYDESNAHDTDGYNEVDSSPDGGQDPTLQQEESPS